MFASVGVVFLIILLIISVTLESVSIESPFVKPRGTCSIMEELKKYYISSMVLSFISLLCLFIGSLIGKGRVFFLVVSLLTGLASICVYALSNFNTECNLWCETCSEYYLTDICITSIGVIWAFFWLIQSFY